MRKSTTKSYTSCQNRFLRFCQYLRISAIPTSEKTLLTFTAYLYKRGLTPSAVNSYLCAIRNLNIINGYAVPEVRSPRIRLALKAILRKSASPSKKLPLTYDKLCTLWPLVTQYKDSLMWKALLSLAFFAGLRCAEYTPSAECPSGPRIEQVTFSRDSKSVKYKVKKSKTKTFGFQCDLACSGQEICAFCNMIDYLKARNRSKSVTGSSQLFVSSSKVVTSKQVNRFIKSTVHSLGWQSSNYSAHSIRAGAASTAARAGFQDWELKCLGGWTSSAYMSYIRDNAHHRAQFPRRMVRGTAN